MFAIIAFVQTISDNYDYCLTTTKQTNWSENELTNARIVGEKFTTIAAKKAQLSLKRSEIINKEIKKQRKKL